MIAAWQVRPPRLVTIARGALHHRLPVRVGHVGDEHVAGLDAVHVGDRLRTMRTGPVPIFWPIARPSASTVPLPLSL